MSAHPNLIDQLRGHIAQRSEAALAAFEALCEVSQNEGIDVYAVGGVLRDILIGLEANRPLDLDLAVDGDPSILHGVLAQAAGQRPSVHDRFGTARAQLPDGSSIDLARTRSETYTSPGALPVVAVASIDVDLARRDFTIHSVALALTVARRGELIDPFGAARDVRSRTIRTLHDLSFRDDPTRLIRAARYAARIGGSVAPQTRAEARRHRPHLAQLTAERFGDAWRLLLQESDAVAALDWARRLQIPQGRLASWTLPAAVLQAAESPDMFWSSVGLTQPESTVRLLPQSVGLTRSERTSVDAGRALRRQRRRLGQLKRPSAIAVALRGVPDDPLEAAARLWDGPSGAAVSDFLARRDAMQSPISARRILELGTPVGPRVGRWLSIIEAALWDGDLDAADGEAIARFEERIRLADDDR